MTRLGRLSLFVVGLLGAGSVAYGDDISMLDRDGSICDLSTGGTAAASIPESFGGTGFAVDQSGNYIIATGSSLKKVTPGGAASLIANAPSGSQFIDVAIDANGNYIVTDNMQHRVLRIDPTGNTITPVATYLLQGGSLEDSWVRVDKNGNYVVAEDSGGGHIFVITPGGSVSPRALTGPSITIIGGMTLDASGDYVVTDSIASAIDAITPGGAVSRLESQYHFSDAAGIVWDSALSEFLVSDRGANSLFSVSANGSTVTSVYSGTPLSAPVDVAVSAAVPEPASLALLLAGGVALGIWRLRRKA